MNDKAIIWIRDDFRLKNNPALSYAINNHKSISVCAYNLHNPNMASKL